MSNQIKVAADLVLEQAQNGVVSTDTYMAAVNEGLDVDFLVEHAEELYELSETEFEGEIGTE